MPLPRRVPIVTGHNEPSRQHRQSFGACLFATLFIVLFFLGDWSNVDFNTIGMDSTKPHRSAAQMGVDSPSSANHALVISNGGRDDGGGSNNVPDKEKIISNRFSERATSIDTGLFNGGAKLLDGPERSLCHGKATVAWPPSVRTLCSMIKAEIRPDFAAFFGSKTPLVKVYSADLNTRKNDGGVNGTMGTVCGRRYREWRYNLGKGDKRAKVKEASKLKFVPLELHHNAYSSKFMAEVILPYIPERTRYHVDDAASADLVFVSLCVGAMGRQGAVVADIAELINKEVAGPDVRKIFQTRPWDIVATVTNDHGPCPNFRESLGGTDKQHPIIEWHGKSALTEITMLTNEGSLRHNCYTPPLHLTIPTTTAVGSTPLACEKPQLEQRTNLIFIAGESSSRIRFKVFSTFEADQEVFTPPEERLPYNEYMCTMADSVFCLVLRGAATWSPRLDESIFAGCIPVLIVDSYEPPYSRLLDYREFAVVIEEASVADHVHLIKQKLLEIPTTERKRLLQNVKKVKPLFRFPDLEAKADDAGNSMFDLTVFQLWKERKAREEHVINTRKTLHR